MLHVIYRSYGGENRKGRPTYYSKLLALASMVRSFGQMRSQPAELIFLNDGPIPADRLLLMENTGEVVSRSDLGLHGSLRAGLEIATSRGWAGDDLVWFSEDDYLYLPSALSELIAAATAFPHASYFGLYALVGSRMPNGAAFEETMRVPSEWVASDRRIVNGHPWCRALSTTSTFGARVDAISEDRRMTQIAMRSGGSFDHTTCLMYQGFSPYPITSLTEPFRSSAVPKSWLRRAGVLGVRSGLNAYQAIRIMGRAERRLLVASDPALITHLESAYMALGTDWTSVAAETRSWLESESGEPPSGLISKAPGSSVSVC